MPVLAQFAPIRGALTFDAGQERGVEGVALRPIAPLTGAATFQFVLGRLFHGFPKQKWGRFQVWANIIRGPKLDSDRLDEIWSGCALTLNNSVLVIRVTH